MYISIMVVALLGPGAAPANQATETPTWQDNYTVARTMGRREKKPLAVFVGSGTKGWEKVSREGKWTPEAQNLLTRNYVCVYVNADSEPGKRLAEAFSMTQGLVLSTRDGNSQAFRHSGQMRTQDLEAILKRYVNSEAVAQTETLEQQRNSYSYAPSYAPAPALHSQIGYSRSFGGFGGGGSC